ncbi:RNA polymerase sigma-70 factor [bacterium]|nr:MAG: RNA polymerase sigma-70 factor [bacterium]
MEVFLFLALAIDDRSKSFQDLALRIRLGDHEAFRAFFDGVHAEVYRFLTAKSIREETAEDIIQQAFIWIWEHRSEIDPEKSLRAYLFRIAYTRFLNHVRDTKKMDEDATFDLIESDTPHADGDVINNELKTAIDKAIASMPEKRRMVFELCYLQELSYKETSEMLEMSIKTVENHMGLALKQLRELLAGWRTN